MGLCDAKRLKKENQDLNNRLNDYKIKERRKNEKINELEAEIKSLMIIVIVCRPKYQN